MLMTEGCIGKHGDHVSCILLYSVGHLESRNVSMPLGVD